MNNDNEDIADIISTVATTKGGKGLGEKTKRLPLWRNVLDELDGTAEYGQVIKADWFEERLNCKRDTLEYAFAIMQIRQGLEYLGMYLDGRGRGGDEFVILQPAENAAVMHRLQRSAARRMCRAVTLGMRTKTELLSDSELREHEKELSKAAYRLALLRGTPKREKIAPSPTAIEDKGNG